MNILKRLAAHLLSRVTPLDDYGRRKTEPNRRRFLSWVRLFNAISPEVEFYPAALEALENPPSPAGRAIAGLIMSFLLMALIWASVGKVDVIATAKGKVIPTGRTKVIQPLESGVVRAIHVQDGQAVRAGDVLIEIDSTITEAERDRLNAEHVAAELDAARLKASLGDAADPLTQFEPPEGAAESEIETQRSLLINQVNEIRAELTGLDRQIAQNEGNRVAVAATIAKLTQSIPMLEERLKIRRHLSEKGYGSKLDTLNAEQDLVEHEQELEAEKGRLVQAEAGIASLMEQRRQAEAEYHRTNLDKLAAAEQKISTLKNQLVQASQKYRLQTLTSPVDGTVQQLAVHTEGGVVTPAQTLMAVVPADSHIEIEAMVSNRDIGFVHSGQEAEIKVDTFNFTRYGLLHGHVVSVSQDAITRENPSDKSGEGKQAGVESDSSEQQGQELVYAARIELEQTRMEVDGRTVPLAPGMAVTAEIKTGSRHVISYLLSPLLRYKQQAFRER